MRYRIAAVVALTMVLAACQSAAENLVENIVEQGLEQEGGGDVDIDLDSGQVQVSGETDDESFNMVIGGGEIPDGFPIPVPDGGTVLTSISQEVEGDMAYSVSLMYPAGQYDDLVAFYQDWINGLGGDVQTFEQSGQVQTITLANPDAGVSVNIAETSEGVNVGLTSGLN